MIKFMTLLNRIVTVQLAHRGLEFCHFDENEAVSKFYLLFFVVVINVDPNYFA